MAKKNYSKAAPSADKRHNYMSVNRGNAKKNAPGSPLARAKAPDLRGLKAKPNELYPILTKKRK